MTTLVVSIDGGDLTRSQMQSYRQPMAAESGGLSVLQGEATLMGIQSQVTSPKHTLDLKATLIGLSRFSLCVCVCWWDTQ